MSTAHLIFLFVQTGGEFCYNDVYADAPMTEEMKNNNWVKGEENYNFQFVVQVTYLYFLENIKFLREILRELFERIYNFMVSLNKISYNSIIFCFS